MACFVLAPCACTGSVEVQIALVAALRPDPFVDVDQVRAVGFVDGAPQVLERVRWDQGPVRLSGRLPLNVERLWVEGLDRGGRVRAAALAPPVDFVAEPPDRISLPFVEIGVLSILPGTVPARRGWRAASLAEDGVLLLGGEDAAGGTPEETFLIAPDGSVESGPPLVGGRAGAAVASAGPRVVVWGGWSRTQGADRRAASFWLRLQLGQPTARVPNPVEPGMDPILVPADARRVTVLAAGEGPSARLEVFELDVSDLRSSPVGQIADLEMRSAFAPLSPRQLVWVGGGTVAEATVYDKLAANITQGSTIAVGGPRTGAAAQTTSAVSTVVAGGREPDGDPEAEVSVLRWPLPVEEGGRAAVFSDGPRLGRARLYDAGGGTLLAASVDTSTLPPWRIDLLGSSAVPLESVSEPFDLAPHPDGTLRGASDAGRLLVFSAGPGVFAPSTETGAGIVPRTPDTWTLEEGGLTGRADRVTLLGSVSVTNWAVLGEQKHRDFWLLVEVIPRGRGRAALLFDLDAEGYTVVALQRSAQIRASPGRPRVPCPAAEVPELDEGTGGFEVSLERRGDVVRLDVGADGSPELVCEVTPLSRGGHLALAVLQEAVWFSVSELSERRL